MDFVTLPTERLLLRPWRFDDAAAVAAYANDERYSRFLAVVPQPYTRADADRFVATAVLTDWDVHPMFAITRDGTPIGGLDLEFSAANRTVSVGYGLASAEWGNGYVAEAATVALEWALHRWPIEKVFATADAENAQSWRVMEKLGMVREGLLRRQRTLRGESRDVVYYGILREEWEALRG